MDTWFEQGNRHAAGGELQQAVVAFSHSLEESPGDWQALVNRANAYMQLKQHDKALDDYLQAAGLNPDSLSIKCNLAVLLKELGEFALAEGLLNEALLADASYVDAWSNLGVVMQYTLRYQEAALCHIKAIELAGVSVGRLNNLGNAYSCALLLEQAEQAYRQALKLEPENHQTRFNLSIVLFLAGRYGEAWPLYESRWGAVLVPRYQQHRWHGDELGNKTLLIWSEQGLGDTLQMARFLPVVRRMHPGARIVLACPKTFSRLFAQFDGVQCVDIAGQHPAFDVQIPLMSLPGVLQIEMAALDAAPYLAADPHLMTLPRASATYRVGVVWETGLWGVGVANHGRQNKSIPLEQFAPLFNVPGCEFISLQLGDIPAIAQGKVQAYPITDFADTAAIISQLDVVVSVDTSVVHLAGALGVPVWVLMRAESAPFFMAHGTASPWYESMTLWRQPEAGQWQDVIQSVASALQNREFLPVS